MSTSTTNNVELPKIQTLLTEWNIQKDKEGYDVVDFLIKLSERFEKLTEDFFKQDPDPFDDRHPASTAPTSGFAELLKAFTKQEEYVSFLDTLIDKYLMHSESNIPKKGQKFTVTEAATRLLLAVMPGLDAINILTEKNSELLQTLYNWAEKAKEPLRTYAVGLLANAVENQEVVTSNNRDNHLILVPVLLKRLWNNIEPGRYPNQNETSDAKEIPPIKTQNSDLKVLSLSKKRKTTEENGKKTKARKLENQPSTSKLKPTKLSLNEKLNFTSDNDELGMLPHFSELDNEVSNSSWVEMMPVVIGCGFSLAPPLSDDLSNRFILKFLTPLAEYQDLLSVFLEHKVLDLIRYFLDKSNTNDGLLTFAALKFFAFMLCHNKIATEFIDTGGLQKLLSVRRPSLGATGVSLCLYYLAYNLDAMEHVCQLSSKVLQSLVRYALWLLECSHESGRCHAALFFSISFQFRAILKIFDQKKGLRCLLNLLSTLPFIRQGGDFPQEIPDEIPLPNENNNKDDEINNSRQTARTTCSALKKYFETHLIIKSKHLKSLKDHSMVSNSNSKVVAYERENVSEAIDFLLAFGSPLSWDPIIFFMELDGIQILLRLIASASDWSNYSCRTDTVRMALDCLAVLTLSQTAQMKLCQNVDLPLDFTKETGIGIIIGVAEGEDYLGVEPEAQKLALVVLINCLSKPAYKANVLDKIPKIKAAIKGKYVEKTTTEVSEYLWELVKSENGIKILLELLLTSEPPTHADEVRLLSCRALCGLAGCESVKQILSKLPLFNNGQAQGLTRQPVMPDRNRIHAKFCKYMEQLTELVSGKPSTSHMDLDSIRKAHIVSQTVIRYDNRELLQLIQSHLVRSGLYETAAMLTREMCLHTPSNCNTLLFSTPRSQQKNNGSGDGVFVSPSPPSRRISFSRGDHAMGQTPTLQPHASHLLTPQRKGKFRFQMDGSNSTSLESASDSFHLSSNGKVTVVEPGIFDPQDRGKGGSPKPQQLTLNTIVAGYLKNQHAHCKNPVVTVPEFSLMRPHNCPEPRYCIKAPLNVGSRCIKRQVKPSYGGPGGARRDRQFIYSRYRPSHVFRPQDDDGSPYTCCSFSYDDQFLVAGDCNGDLAIHGLHTDQDRVIEGAGESRISYLQLTKDNETTLLVDESVLRTTCSLFSLTSLDTKCVFNNTYYVEFSKTNEDKVIGTKNSVATIFDSRTAQIIQTFKGENSTSHYTENKATFSPDDDLILSDGLLWDVRANPTKPIHKFDKFNSKISGIFHPKGLEVIINTEIWDLRNYHLLHTVPSLDQCSLKFNYDASIMYASKSVMDAEEMEEETQTSTTFQTIDARDYSSISVTDTKHQIYDLAADNRDLFVAVVERQSPDGDQQWENASYMSVCRMYEVGRVRGEDEEEEDHLDQMEDESNDDEDLNDQEDDNDDDASSLSSQSLRSALGELQGRRDILDYSDDSMESFDMDSRSSSNFSDLD